MLKHALTQSCESRGLCISKPRRCRQNTHRQPLCKQGVFPGYKNTVFLKMPYQSMLASISAALTNVLFENSSHKIARRSLVPVIPAVIYPKSYLQFFDNDPGHDEGHFSSVFSSLTIIKIRKQRKLPLLSNRKIHEIRMLWRLKGHHLITV